MNRVDSKRTRTAGPTAKDVDEYIAGFPDNVQSLLRKVRETIQAAAPRAQETISYGMPTFTLDGRYLIYFGAYKKHIGIYPVPTTHPELEEALRPYASGKGSARFPLNKPLPYALITKIVELKLRAGAGKQAAAKQAAGRRAATEQGEGSGGAA